MPGMSDVGRRGRGGDRKSSCHHGGPSWVERQRASEAANQLDGIEQSEPEPPAEVVLVEVDDGQVPTDK
jgi:hypothetical protein